MYTPSIARRPTSTRPPIPAEMSSPSAFPASPAAAPAVARLDRAAERRTDVISDPTAADERRLSAASCCAAQHAAFRIVFAAIVQNFRQRLQRLDLEIATVNECFQVADADASNSAVSNQEGQRPCISAKNRGTCQLPARYSAPYAEYFGGRDRLVSSSVSWPLLASLNPQAWRSMCGWP